MLTKETLIARANAIINGDDIEFLNDYEGTKLTRVDGNVVKLHFNIIDNVSSLVSAINDCEDKEDLMDMNEYLDSIENAIDRMVYHQDINRVVDEARKFAYSKPSVGQWHAGGAYIRDDFGNQCLSITYEMGEGIVKVA